MRLALALLCVPVVAAAVPNAITHSGRLLSSTGEPMSGAVPLTVRLFDAETAGNQLWADSFTPTVEDGYFSVQLDAVDATVLASGTVWVEVDAGSPMARQPLLSVPYAISAGSGGTQSGTFTARVQLSTACTGATPPVNVNAPGRYTRVGDLVTISISDLPVGATYSGHCIHYISDLPFEAATAASFAVGHARGIQFKWNNTVIDNFTLSAHIQPNTTSIVTNTSSSVSPFSGWWFLSGTDNVYVHSVTGSYFTDEP